MPRSGFSQWFDRFRPSTQVERRSFLKATLAGSAGLLLSKNVVNARLTLSQRRVIIVGGGFSGLACAHELQAAGHDVQVFEARNRISGRVLSANEANRRPFLKGMNVEFGGELIGSNHPAWVQYADLFDLRFQDLGEDENAASPIVIDGRSLTAAEAESLWEELDSALNGLNALAAIIPEDAPWNAPQADNTDRTSVQAWIDALDVAPVIKRALWINFSADNGCDAHLQSLLGLLTAVKGGGLERYWSESEVYRCQGGNDQLASKLAEAIGYDRIQLRTPIRQISRIGDHMRVETAAGAVFDCDDVVLTAPPRTWPKIRFSPELPQELNPQTGHNAKYFAIVSKRFWQDQQLSQYALSDAGLHMTWEGTDGQGDIPSGSGVCIVGFAGGSVCEQALNLAPAERQQLLNATLERLYPGFNAHFQRGFYMNWPHEPWSGAGYSFPAPGQVTTVGPMLAQTHMDGKLHIAGEHACYKFVGYMEGALQSGIRVANMTLNA